MLIGLSLIEIMDLPLPKLSVQKKLGYKPTQEEVDYLYDLINKDVFDNMLPKPELKLGARCRKFWGMCYGEEKPCVNGSYCRIKLMDKWYCVQWLVTILAHEMCHQYQWDVYSANRRNRVISHGPSFYLFQMKLKKHNISLKAHYSTKRWLETQDLFKS